MSSLRGVCFVGLPINDVGVQSASRFRVHLADLTRGGRGVVAERWAKKKVLIFLCLMVGSC